MKNLLPLSERQTVTRQYYVRLCVVALALVCATGVVWLVVLIPSYVLVHSVQRELSEELSRTQAHIENSGVNDARRFLQKTAQMVDRAHLVDTMPQATSLLTATRATLAPGIIPTSIVLTVQSATSARAVVQGRATTRSHLVAYSSALESDEQVASVTLPLRDLAANRDIPFTLTIDFSL